MSNPYHTPVLLKACIENLNLKPSGTYVDITFGGGGHSKEILKHLGKNGKLYAFDQDRDAEKNLINNKQFIFINQNFRHLKNYLRLNNVFEIDGVLGDLGVSSHQFDSGERGFSIRYDAPLDMRMNQKNPLCAETVVNGYGEEKLISVFKNYGELTSAKKISNLIYKARDEKKIETTFDLKEILKPISPKFEEHKFFAKVFQALRIEVNEEMNALSECLNQCVELLKPGGRMVMISYHSLEDRMVKNTIKTGNAKGIEKKDMIYGRTEKKMKSVFSKVITPEEEEIKFNTRARSAKLRVGEKI